MSFILVVNRLDAVIKRLEQLIQAQTGKPPEPIPPEELPPITVITERLPNAYKLFNIDLSQARADTAIGLRDILKQSNIPYASYMSIVRIDAAFSFKLNSAEMDAIDGAIGLEWDDFEIKEIYITNAAAAGGNIALIVVEWRAD